VTVQLRHPVELEERGLTVAKGAKEHRDGVVGVRVVGDRVLEPHGVSKVRDHADLRGFSDSSSDQRPPRPSP
jgi:hypothetical protein